MSDKPLKGFSVALTPEVEADIRRLVVRFAVMRTAYGWSVNDLSKEAKMWRSNIDRFENGEVIPTLPTLLYLARIIGLHLEWVPEHLLPLLTLDEFELEALLGATVRAYESEQDEALASALSKLGRTGDGCAS